MKALILAAGFGTRLAPYTETLPKALFPMAGTPLLGRMIAQLAAAGCTAIAVNAHHRAEQVAAYLGAGQWAVPVHLSVEPQILGTGGALRRLADFWDAAPFLVINADIVTDIDLAQVYRRHREQRAPVSLVMHDREPFNQVLVDDQDRVTGFARLGDPRAPQERCLAFTGIHVIDPTVIAHIPAEGFSDIIDVYRQRIRCGETIRAQVVHEPYWQDVGTPASYVAAVLDRLRPQAFTAAFGAAPAAVSRLPLAGDGSDRRWTRLLDGERSLILAEHGITPTAAGSEVNAFVAIGRHLHRCGLPVPRIYAHDTFSGLVLLEDLGDLHLQQWVQAAGDETAVAAGYRAVIDTWIDLTERALAGFDANWTCQSEAYDAPLIVEKECRYFLEAFVGGYLAMEVDFQDLADEFAHLARAAVREGHPGLIHRDLQSRNIMLWAGRPHLIDFQGARRGPVQYDLASLLIDPYVALGPPLQQELLNYAVRQATVRLGADPEAFLRGYRLCAVTRNLQMLGAFGFLSRVKGKPAFSRWIPAAAAMLPRHLAAVSQPALPRLGRLAAAIARQLPAA